MRKLLFLGVLYLFAITNSYSSEIIENERGVSYGERAILELMICLNPHNSSAYIIEAWSSDNYSVLDDGEIMEWDGNSDTFKRIIIIEHHSNNSSV